MKIAAEATDLRPRIGRSSSFRNAGHEPGPAVGLLWSPHTRRGPVEGLLAEAVGVFEVKAMHVRSLQHGQIGLVRSAPPQPQALGNARLARQAFDLYQYQGAAHDGFR